MTITGWPSPTGAAAISDETPRRNDASSGPACNSRHRLNRGAGQLVVLTGRSAGGECVAGGTLMLALEALALRARPGDQLVQRRGVERRAGRCRNAQRPPKIALGVDAGEETLQFDDATLDGE